MAVSDDAILTLAKEVGESAHATRELTAQMKAHIEDRQAHSGIIPRTESIERSRRWFRRIIIGSVITTPAAGAKLGWFSTLIATIKAGGS